MAAAMTDIHPAATTGVGIRCKKPTRKDARQNIVEFQMSFDDRLLCLGTYLDQ